MFAYSFSKELACKMFYSIFFISTCISTKKFGLLLRFYSCAPLTKRAPLSTAWTRALRFQELLPRRSTHVYTQYHILLPGDKLKRKLDQLSLNDHNPNVLPLVHLMKVENMKFVVRTVTVVTIQFKLALGQFHCRHQHHYNLFLECKRLGCVCVPHRTQRLVLVPQVRPHHTVIFFRFYTAETSETEPVFAHTADISTFLG